MRINAQRLNDSLETLAKIGLIENGGVTRLALTDIDRDARDVLKIWLIEAGMSIRIDDFGNMMGRREGTEDLPPVVIGSHLDTVRSGGQFDGALGVLGALEVVRTLNDYGIATRYPIEVVNFTNEEGTRFQPSILGSGALIEKFAKEFVYDRVDQDGLRFDAELKRIGYCGSVENRLRQISAYVELHIEQGPKLEDAGLQVGVVDGIVGDTWIAVSIEGQADHAGPSPMGTRRDALVAASQLVLDVQQIALDEGDPAVGTVGRLNVEPNVINTIPGRVEMSVDLRNYDSQLLTTMVDRLHEVAQDIAARQNVTIEIDRYWTIEPTPFASELIAAVSASCRELGHEEFHLWSGAGHDAKYMAERWPSTMIFARSRNGLSHNAKEFTSHEDVEAAANVLLLTTARLAVPREQQAISGA